jgi:capsular polysaccharide biosynthesis protein
MILNLPRPVIWRPNGFVPSLEELNSTHGVLAKNDVATEVDVRGDGAHPSSVVDLAEGRIVGDLRLVVTHNGLAVGKLQSLIGSEDPGRHYLLRNPRFRLWRRLRGVGLVLAIPEAANYYHWLLNSAPRWKLLEAAGRTRAYDYVLLTAAAPHFQDETLDRMGVPPNKRLRCSTLSLLQFERLVVPDMPLPRCRVPSWVCDWVRSLFPERDPNAPKLLYVSRRAATRRRLANEPVVEPHLKKLGFSIVQPERLGLLEQVKLFSAAECIVAPHGAGLANIVFAPPGAHLVELFHPDAKAVCYQELAQVCGLRYSRLTGHPGGSPKAADFTIDVPELLKLVQAGGAS